MRLNKDTAVGDYNEAMQVWRHCFACDPKYIPHVFENCYACPLMNVESDKFCLIKQRNTNGNSSK